MAKQHRMAVLNIALAAAVIEKIVLSEIKWSMTIALGVIAVGSLWTSVRRMKDAARKLNDSKTLPPASEDGKTVLT